MSKFEYPAGVLPEIEMYGGDTTKWKIPLKKLSGASYTEDELSDGYHCALTITPYSMASSNATEPVIIKNVEIQGDGAGGAMCEFLFEIADTINLSGKFVYQIELYNQDHSRIAQGYLHIRRNNNPLRVDLSYSGNTGHSGGGSSIVGGFRIPVRGEDYWTDEDRHEIIAAVVSAISSSLPVRGEDYWTEDDQETIINAVLVELEDDVEALRPVRGTDYWTASDKSEIVSSAVTTIRPELAALAPVRGTDYWTNADKAAIVSDVMNEVADDIIALKPVKGTDYWTSADVADLKADIADLVDEAVIGLFATVEGTTLVIDTNSGSANSGGAST